MKLKMKSIGDVPRETSFHVKKSYKNINNYRKYYFFYKEVFILMCKYLQAYVSRETLIIDIDVHINAFSISNINYFVNNLMFHVEH